MKKVLVWFMSLALVLSGCAGNGAAENSAPEQAAEQVQEEKDPRFDVSSEINGKDVTFTNNYAKEGAEFAWYFYYGEDRENPDRFMYHTNDGSITYTFEEDGEYSVKSYVKVGEEIKAAYVATVTVNEDSVNCVLK